MEAQDLFENNQYTIEQWRNMNHIMQCSAIWNQAAEAGIEKEYVEYICENLGYFNRFIEESHKVVNVGFKHYSHVLIAHVIRHHTAIEDSSKLFKINNNATPRVARMAVALFPALNGLFEFRGLK